MKVSSQRRASIFVFDDNSGTKILGRDVDSHDRFSNIIVELFKSSVVSALVADRICFNGNTCQPYKHKRQECITSSQQPGDHQNNNRKAESNVTNSSPKIAYERDLHIA